MYHVIAAFLWASSGIVVDVDVDATCSKFNDMFFFSFSFFAPILFEALCMVCKFFTWPHFCILCGNTLEASGRLGSYPVRAVKITKRWLRRRTTDDKVCEKAIQLAVNQLTRLEDSTTSHSAHSAAASSPPPPPFSPFLILFCWLAI